MNVGGRESRVVGGGCSSFVMCPTTAPASLAQLSGPPIDETPPCMRERAHANWRCPKLLSAVFGAVQPTGLAFQCWMIIVVHRVVLDWRGQG